MEASERATHLVKRVHLTPTREERDIEKIPGKGRIDIANCHTSTDRVRRCFLYELNFETMNPLIPLVHGLDFGSIPSRFEMLLIHN